MPSPTERLSRLSLYSSMPPTTRLQSQGQQQRQRQQQQQQQKHHHHHQDKQDERGALRPRSVEAEFDEDEDEDDDDDAPPVIVSPSKLTYSLDGLDEGTRDSVVDTFCFPPQMTLKAYASRGKYVVFQVAELLPYWIQTGAEDSQYPAPTCGCGAKERPCRHLIWLFDQLSSQMLTHEGQTLTMTRGGYAAELGNPFARISDFHVDMLAESLHCNSSGSGSGHSPRRVQEIREMLASLNETPLDEYRPDLFGDGDGGAGGDNSGSRDNDNDNGGDGGGGFETQEDGEAAIIERRDLEKTVYRMLLQNDEFFSYFLSSMPTDELVNNRFRRLEQRAAAALAGLDAYAAESAATTAAPASNPATAAAAPTTTTQAPTTTSTGTRPKDVEWCAAHLVLAMDQIYAAIQHARAPLTAAEQRAAARAVVRTLEGVVARAGRAAGPAALPRAQRDLYFCLVGDRDRGFGVRALRQLAPAVLAPWADRLAAVEARVCERGAPPSYVQKLRSLLAWIRSSASSSSTSMNAAAGAKRSSPNPDYGGGSSRAKRMK
ncbi:hypothetical protein SLS62_001134 [Diatrype stigma]|uniref:SWIM-type domain-containing protein n=1 Tax=Diatrype stigma TaxID=117547 RepID=A0AAN9YRX3_9PEZI